MTIEDIKRKLAEYNERVTEFVEKYRQDDDHIYYEVGETSYVIHASQFGLHYEEPAVSEMEITTFEEEQDIRLPEGYRAFLLEIGNGDQNGENTLGPWLWLYPFRRAQSLLEGDLSKPFPYTDRWDMKTNPLENPYDGQHTHGTLNIGTGGCTIEYFLVVTGNERGHVWIDDRGADYGLWPLVIHEDRVSEDYGYLPNNDFSSLSHVDFISWYGHWLDARINGIDKWKGKYGRDENK